MTRIAPPLAPEAPHAAPAPSAASRAGGGQAPSGPAGAAAEAAAPASAAPNPRLRMDPELGLVVLEFRSLGGEAAATLPTSRELEAYRRAVRAGALPPASRTESTAPTHT